MSNSDKCADVSTCIGSEQQLHTRMRSRWTPEDWERKSQSRCPPASTAESVHHPPSQRAGQEAGAGGHAPEHVLGLSTLEKISGHR